MDPENVVRFGADKSPLPDAEFEGYYNRDSTKYRTLYHIPEAETVVRGTYRYKVRMCVCMCTHVQASVCVCVCVCVCMCTHVQASVCVCVHVLHEYSGTCL